MDVERDFPLRLWINLSRREDRRLEMESNLAEAKVSAERFPAIDAKRYAPRGIPKPDDATANATGDSTGQDASVRGQESMRGYETAGRYALALTQRLALREARRRRAPAVLLLEDDAIFHPNFQVLARAVELPTDWGILYFGCAHSMRPEWSGIRVVKVKSAVDTHAIAIRAPYYARVMDILDRHGKVNPGVAAASDQFIALLHSEIPTYACYPNLVWQGFSQSDLIDQAYSNYTTDGRQRNWVSSIAGLLDEVVAGGSRDLNDKGEDGEQTDRPNPSSSNNGRRSREPRLGLLFLTRGDVNHPEIWREFVAESPERTRIFSHPKFPDLIEHGSFLSGTAIGELHETKWGTISLVRAARSLLLSALEDESLTHFALLSESCVPVRPLPEILRSLELDPRSRFGFKTLRSASARHTSRIGASPRVPVGCWRFTSQWWLMNRASAVISVGQDYTHLFEGMFVPDESYFATVLAMQGFPLEGEVVNRDVTWTWWEKDAGSPKSLPRLPLELLESLLHSGALFARKFPKDADIGTFGLHRSASNH